MFHSATLRAVAPPSVTSPRTADVWRAHPGYIGAWFVDVVLAGGLGLSALLSDPVRYSSPAYLFMRNTPGGIPTWGAALLFGAVLLVVGACSRAQLYALILTGGTAIYLLLATWIALSAVTDARASWWGPILFLGIAIWHGTQSNEHRRSANAMIAAAAAVAARSEPEGDPA